MSVLGDLDARSLRREMGALAAEIMTDGEARLAPGRDAARYMSKIGARVNALLARGEWDALTRLSETLRPMEACARQAALSAVRALPACGGVPRVEFIARRICKGGDASPDLSALMLAVDAFDDVQGLTMAELWAVPQAMRVVACDLWIKSAKIIVRAAEARIDAENWAYSGGADENLAGRDCAFYERALQLALELEKPDLRIRIDAALTRADSSADASVRLAHETRALAALRVNSMMAVSRMVDSADWQEAFERVSRTEAVLLADPAGVYPIMTQDSRAAVRAEVARLSGALGVGETTVARYAVKAADGKKGVCWWLCDDAGRRALAGRLGVKARLPRVRPDPHGAGYATGVISLSVVLSLLLAAVCGAWWVFFAALPLTWRLVAYGLSQCLTRVIKPRRLLALDFSEGIPDSARTLVVVPALIPNPKRGVALCRQLEVLGCLETDKNLDFLLLGDFPDSPGAEEAGDNDILNAVRGEIDELNARSERRKYHYLHRNREHAAADGIFRGRARKRGALMDLGKLLIGRDTAAFSAECGAADALAGKFPYVLTLDADTRMLPGTAAYLAGALAHPLNDCAILQPCVEFDPVECKNRFVRLFAGTGGMSAYSALVSDLFQDLMGVGNYCGKGIIDMPAFVSALDGRLDDERILSHDLIEGMLAGAKKAGDISVFDGYPATYARYLARAARWTRGDWQLLPEILRRDLRAFDKFRIISNLIDSLWEVSLIHLLIISLWLDSRAGFALGVVFVFAVPVISRLLGDKQALYRGCVELAALPAAAYVHADAIYRALFRTFISKKKLLEWVASADASGDDRLTGIMCRAGALLLLPGLFSGAWLTPALALGALFLAAPGWLKDMEAEAPFETQALPDPARETLSGLARDTWRFFERYVDASGNFLPPDNVQIDPDAGIARRTSPTNIAMYMLSCVTARDLGFIGDGEMRGRLNDTIGTLEKMEKWRGHLFNWYSTSDLTPLKPRYVSAVDSGNLAAALLLCGEALNMERASQMARDMDFTALYDKKRELFYIGADVERGRMSASHYDLLASEARTLTYAAIMLGQVGTDAWRALGRPVAGNALLSWSGTMFEYFMPALITRPVPGTLMGNTFDAVVKAQMNFAKARMRPWGVSESGYYAFDMSLNYQYRAFGMREMAMSGPVPQEVVAPYAACLALCAWPADAAKNIERMLNMGWAGDCGLYEAADFTRRDVRLVKSWMSHHQGMALCAIGNALNGDKLVGYFMANPRAQAIRLLLNERPAPRVRLKRVRQEEKPRFAKAEPRLNRAGRPDSRLCDSALLGGAGATAFVTARGDIHYWRNGVYAARFTGDLLRRRDGIATYVRDMATGKRLRVNSAEAQSVLGAGEAVYALRLGGAEIRMRAAISPEDGALVRQLRVSCVEPCRLEISDVFEVALMNAGEMRAHPAFFRLFCRADFSRANSIVYTRRARDGKTVYPALYHAAAGADCVRQTDWMRVNGRLGASEWDGDGLDGAQIDPCSALKCEIELRPGEAWEISFTLGLCPEADVGSLLARYSLRDYAGRALRLAGNYAQYIAGYAGLDAELTHIVNRAAAFIIDPRLARRLLTLARASNAPLPGDTPVISVTISGADSLHVLRDAIRMHEYCRALGLEFQIAAVNDYGSDYSQPVRDGINEMIDAGYLRDMRSAPNGITVIDAENLTREAREALRARAALAFDGGMPFRAQLRRALGALEYVPGPDYAPMPGGGGFPEIPDVGRLAADYYEMRVAPDAVLPAPWSNVITGERMGALITERGGGFIWHQNSRLRRVTCFDNDPAWEGWGVMAYVADVERALFARCLPGDVPLTPFRVRHGLSESVFYTRADGIDIETAVFADDSAGALKYLVKLTNSGDAEREITVTCFVDWLMGADASEAAFTRSWTRDGALFAGGAMDGVAYLCCGERAEAGPERSAFLGHGGVMRPDGLLENGGGGGCVLRARVVLSKGGEKAVCFTLGCEADTEAAYAAARQNARISDAARRRARDEWVDRRDAFSMETGDANLDVLINGFFVKQTLDGRVRARAGFYQAGGAYGFRDQLQDMLALLPYDAERVRGHILLCAERQFLDGDVMHWWHAPAKGVRTRVTDDMLFLPFVTARYAKYSGDTEILGLEAGYLENEIIPEGFDDWYGEARVSSQRESVHGHCMRAFRRAYRPGERGLLLMGGGDWNDGMNRVGAEGRGESVWLTMFFAVCAREYAEILPDSADKTYLTDRAAEALLAVENSAWDGAWYARAFADDGSALGVSGREECRIDMISQAWAAIAGLDPSRVRRALNSARENLFDREAGVIRLLTPPFTGKGFDPGYISAYPPGVRENGGQYTHAACWYLLACSVIGDWARAREALDALMPINHAKNAESAEVYRVEPYVVAADIYGEEPYLGRGGWTWYTGAAGWLLCALRSLVGFERRGSMVRIRPLAGVWENVRVRLRFGESVYILRTEKGAPADFIEMRDDAREHECVFGFREGSADFEKSGQ